MIRPVSLICGALCAFVIVACSVDTPLAPVPVVPASGPASDGSTLKVTAPRLVSPINDATLQTQTATLVIAPATGQYTTQSFNYQFDLQTDTGAALGGTTTPGTSWTPANQYGINQRFRWRARAVTADGVGPWSSFGTFQSPKLVIPTFTSSNDDWKTWFFTIIDLRGVGPLASPGALIALLPDFGVAGVILETNSAQQPRGRLYLPTGNPNNLYSRSVDIGDFGKPWQWVPRGGTVCEGGNCPK